MLLINPARQYEVDGISIQEGLQTAGRISGWTLKTNCLILHLAHSVDLECFVNGQIFRRRIVPGDFHVIPQGTPVGIQLSGPSELIVVSFDDDVLRSIAHDIGSHSDLCLAFQFSLRDIQILNLMRALQEELKSGCDTGGSEVRLLGAALIRSVAKRYSVETQRTIPPSDGLPPNRLRTVLDFIHTNLAKHLGLTELAAAIHMTPQHFANLFRKSTGHAPHEYVVQERIERAKHLLAETSVPIAEIALQVGFANQSHLTDSFRRLAGVTPWRYRRRFERFDPGNPNEAS